MKKIFFLLLFACSIATSYAWGASPSLRDVQASLKQAGDQKTLERYFSCERYEDSAYPQIARGDRAWISLAVRMLQHSDACYTEDILSTLGKAMQARPGNVLPYVNSSPLLRADRICLPFISDEIPVSEQLQQLRAAKRSVLRIKNAALATQRKACLAEIRNIEQALEKKAPE